MAFKVVILSLVLGLTGCITTPDFETGEGCWRYGVSEDSKVIRAPADKIIYLSDMRAIVAACNGEAWGCYRPVSNTIYLYDQGGQRTLNHEKCHSIGLMEHNNCYTKGYGLGEDVAACDWDEK